ncbi:glycerophosphodiester phosphodiesterase [Sanguibacter hominis ATCC BAA-789]|uniref:Glycerophosphodiester phosphodiesterase n=1 Tax=Sanguibacter hominis ATCC BAA-789 TaxID=1312740 RepID=A0A9X5FGC3_9MICO|nr:glycerophosphodiester phosphodiesterase family protein [Sanguibacter hominis]NKX93944.1 glycerophosphodiester phosphodiesterase [Sanguibacter hominis ATCC BAA-789]
MTTFIAHRGASAAFAEHTRAAYVQALADGADGLECDVQLTADGEVVLWHDATLDRTSDATGDLHRLTLAELRALDAFSWRTPAVPDSHGEAGTQVLTLGELALLAIAADRPVVLVVELKHPSPFGHALEDATLDVLRGHGWDPESGRLGDSEVTVCFMSFFPSSLEHLAPHVPGGALMFLVDELSDAELVADLDPGAQPTPTTVAAARALVAHGMALVIDGAVGGFGPSVAWCRAHPDDVRALVAQGRTLRVWTVDDVTDAELLVGLGVAELTTNTPRELRAALSRRDLHKASTLTSQRATTM